MSAHREQSTLKSAYLFEGTCRCRCCVDACNAVFTLNSITLYSTPCGSYKASDTELKQWAIYEARFELSNPPANTPQPQPAKKARAGPLDVLDAILGAPATTSSASATSLVDAELSVYLQAVTLSVERNRRLNGGQQTLPGTRCRLQKPSAISATVKIGSEIGNKLT